MTDDFEIRLVSLAAKEDRENGFIGGISSAPPPPSGLGKGMRRVIDRLSSLGYWARRVSS